MLVHINNKWIDRACNALTYIKKCKVHIYPGMSVPGGGRTAQREVCYFCCKIIIFVYFCFERSFVTCKTDIFCLDGWIWGRQFSTVGLSPAGGWKTSAAEAAQVEASSHNPRGGQCGRMYSLIGRRPCGGVDTAGVGTSCHSTHPSYHWTYNLSVQFIAFYV